MYLTRSHAPRPTFSLAGWYPTLPIAATILAMALTVTVPIPGQSALGQLVTHGQADRLGLERAWFAQVDLDPARHRIANWLLQDNFLYAVTTGGTIHVLDATTGKTVWATQVGNPRYPTLGPAANQNYVTVINGSKIILLNRANGHIKWTRQAGDAPLSGPALSETRVFVALTSGRVEAYPLDDEKLPTWYYQSSGRVFHHPVVTAKSICWATDLGYLYVGRLDPLSLLYRLETRGEIVASPTGMDPHLLIGSTDGNLYCIHEQNGAEHWSYITGYPITKNPAVVNKLVFVTSREPALHVLDATTGQRRWTAAGVTQFVALGKQHVYGMDRFGSLLVMDTKTGGLVGRLPHSRLLSAGRQDPWSERGPALVNDQNDRIFLVNETGLVQCLHEIGVTEPIVYRQPASDSDTKAGSTDAEQENPTNSPPQEDRSPEPDSSPVDTNAAKDGSPSSETPTEPAPADDPFGDSSNPFSE